MSDLWTLQSNLNRGELTPLLAGRQDLETYYNGVESALNTFGFPQGGQIRRPGTEFIDDALWDGKLFPFSYNTEDNYLLVFTPFRMRVYKDDVLVEGQKGADFVVTYRFSVGQYTNDGVAADKHISYYCHQGYPDWIDGISYRKWQYVTNDAQTQIYRCTQSHTSVSADNGPGVGADTADYWELIGTLASAQPGVELWTDGTYYNKGEYLYVATTVYKCLQSHTAVDALNNPATGTSNVEYWAVFRSGVGLAHGAEFTRFWTQLAREDTLPIFQTKIPYNLAQIGAMDYIQSQDTIVITHEDVIPIRIRRFADDEWIVDEAPLLNIPQFDFEDDDSPSPTSQVQTITFDGSAADGDRFKISLNGILTEEVVYSKGLVLDDDKMASTSANIRQALLGHTLTGNRGVEVASNGVNTNIYVVTFSGDSANDWELLGITYIYSSTTTVAAVVITTPGEPRTEDTWSLTRLWPKTCTFHEGRLWFGGSQSRTNTVWGSKVNDFYNFDKGRSFADDSIEATLDTDRVNAIEALFSNRTLQVFTSGSEFYVPESPITPENVAFSPQTSIGSKRVRPVTIDGVTLFVQETGKAVVQFLFVDEFKANQSSSISTQAEHLIKNPVSLSARRGTTGSDVNNVFIVNTDGTVTVFNTFSSEEVAGFTRWETGQDQFAESVIRSLAVVDNTVYTLTRRGVQPPAGTKVTNYYIEKENSAYYVDCATNGTPTDEGGGVAQLDGLLQVAGDTVYIRADGKYIGTGVVNVSGEVQWAFTGSLPTTATAGLLFLPEVKTMPINVNLANGPNAYSKKRIVRIGLNVVDSNGLIVNDETITDTESGGVLVPKDGSYRIFVHGWSLEAQATITQATPEPFTLLNIGLEVKT